ncbi:restriction endonuclease [Shumkonia mesophila]|uniref:restriction endonuclease n=1 Tax=Shumkonia mesophila TaxID=2838854 RepID=UPI0029352AA1|nr:restriction endonuclease [Shumkonia mesophila]
MGSINFEATAMFGSLSDIVGTKSGLALNEQRLRTLLARDEYGRFGEYLEFDDDDWVRIESVVYEDMVEFLLYSVGRLERPDNPMPVIGAYHKYKHDPKALELVYKISDGFTGFLNNALADPDLGRGDKIDPSPFMRKCHDEYGKLGLDIAYDLITSYAIQLEIKSSHFPAISEWKDTAELEDLFRSEGLTTLYGHFFDQRYIDYLHRNFDDIDRINWRKFEGLTGEYFYRQGFRVEIGPGRNDNGVDVRVWSADESPESPPAIIIQCKRQKDSVSKVVVKALYADVLDAKASSGLIVTTSKLAPGARNVCAVRRYPIEEAGRETLREWVGEMRKPGLGMAT